MINSFNHEQLQDPLASRCRYIKNIMFMFKNIIFMNLNLVDSGELWLLAMRSIGNSNTNR